MRELLSSPRRRRRLIWAGLVLTVAASATVVGVFFPNTGQRDDAPFTKGPVQVVGPAPKAVKYTAREQRDVAGVAAEFVATAVLRNHTERSYDLTDPAFRQGLSRGAWRTGNIPVVPYPRKALAVVKWKLDYSFKDRVGLKVSFIPKHAATVGGMVFNIELHRVGPGTHRRWLVDDWTPAGLASPAPKQAAGQPLGPVSAPRAGLSAAWLVLPVALVFGLILLVPIVLALRGLYRRTRANRTYSMLSER